MTDRVLTLPIDRDTLTTITTPELVHRLAMTHLPNLNGMSPAIRHDTTTLFRTDLPSGPLGAPGTIILRLRGNAVDPTLDAVDTPALEDGYRIVATIAAETRATIDGKKHATPVADHRAQDWIAVLLERNGLHPTELHLSPARAFGTANRAKKHVHFTVRDLLATITITDNDLATRAWDRGIGRGRAYGLGMIVTLPST